MGARERRNEIVGTIAEPQNKEADLLEIRIPLQYDPKS